MAPDHGQRADHTAPKQSEAPVPVLIVDDNAGKRLALKSVLAPMGYRIVEADSGVNALRCLLEEDFAVILMDVRMPHMDGFETAQLIRQRKQSELTPIIFITAFGKDALSDLAAYATGAADFIFSPVPTAELKAKVSVFANIYRRARMLAAQARALQESTDELALLTDTAPIGIFRTSGAGLYEYVNARWSQITGLTFAEAVGQPWHIVASKGEVTEDDPNPFGYLEGGDAVHSMRFRTRRLGESEARVVQSAVNPLLGRDKTVRGWVGTLSDVTDEEMAERILRDARDAALAATLMQHNFTASASHELKTPTTSIVGFIEEVLENDELSEDDRTCLDIALRNALRLSALIDDLLILGQEDVGAIGMTLEPTAVAVLVETVVASFSATAQRAEIELETCTESGDMDDDLWALVDARRLEQALTNLMSNALKFTPPGGRIDVLLDAVGDSVRITVQDTGMGISPEALDGVFSRFYRAREVTEGGIQGTGLGLAIAQQMVEAQGGELTVTSEIGKGSTFVIRVPRADLQLTG